MAAIRFSSLQYFTTEIAGYDVMLETQVNSSGKDLEGRTICWVRDTIRFCNKAWLIL